MERLLAHPAGLPLVHVDHSHRAPAVRTTGECYKVTIPNSGTITASFYANVQGGEKEYRNTRSYNLDEPSCADHSKLIVSEKEAKNVYMELRKMANYSSRLHEDLQVDVQMVNERRGGGGGFIMRLQHNPNTQVADVVCFLDGSQAGVEQNSGKVIKRLRAFLTDNYDKPDEPLFFWCDPPRKEGS